MEFEPNTPASAEDIALARVPKVTLQPYHDVQIDSYVTDRSHQSEGSFDFESESTTLAAQTVQSPRLSHHHTALLTAVGTVMVFGVILATLLMLR